MLSSPHIYFKFFQNSCFPLVFGTLKHPIFLWTVFMLSGWFLFWRELILLFVQIWLKCTNCVTEKSLRNLRKRGLWMSPVQSQKPTTQIYEKIESRGWNFKELLRKKLAGWAELELRILSMAHWSNIKLGGLTWALPIMCMLRGARPKVSLW